MRSVFRKVSAPTRERECYGGRIRSRAFRVTCGVMAMLFAFAAAVQYNDPDPLFWIIVYGVVCAVSAVAALGRPLPYGVPLSIGLAVLGWATTIAWRVPGVEVYFSMFNAWEMKSVPIEEAREATGLFVAGTWAVLLAFLSGRAARNRRNSSPHREGW